MRWASVPVADLPELIVFDGDCILCSHWARWVDRRDTAGRFRFVTIQSPLGRTLADRFGVRADNPETNIVVANRRAHFKADAALVLLAAFAPLSPLRLWGVLPKRMRDWLYDHVARNRYRLFGRREACLVADAGLRARLIERLEDLT